MSLFIVLRNVTGNYLGISGSVKLLHKPCKLSCTNACQRSRRSYASPEFPFVFVLVCREFVSFFLIITRYHYFHLIYDPHPYIFHTKGHNPPSNVYTSRSTCFWLPRVPFVYIASSPADVIWQLLGCTPEASNEAPLLGRASGVGRQPSYRRRASVWPENS